MDKYVIKVKRKHVCEESNIARKNLKDTDDNEKEYNSNKSEMSLFNHNISVEKNDKISTPSLYENIDINFPGIKSSSLNWQTIKRDNLDLLYTILFKNSVGQSLIKIFEEEFEYFTGDLARVKVFGKWCDIPRKQVRSYFFLYEKLETKENIEKWKIQGSQEKMYMLLLLNLYYLTNEKMPYLH